MKNSRKKNLPVLTILILFLIISCKKESEQSGSKAINLYFTEWSTPEVGKIDLVNTPDSAITLFGTSDGIINPTGIALTADGYLIVTDEQANQILKMQKDGSGSPVVLYDTASGVKDPTAIAVDDATGTLYWCNSGTYQVMKGSTDGTATATAMYGGQEVLDYAYGLAIDTQNGKLYICDFYDFILVGNLDGTGAPAVLFNKSNAPGMISPSNIFIDPSHNRIYWCDEGNDEIIRASLNGLGTPVVLFDNHDGVDRPDGIYVDSGAKKIYWTETNNKVIARGNLDGSGTREVLVNNVKSYCLTLEFQP